MPVAGEDEDPAFQGIATAPRHDTCSKVPRGSKEHSSLLAIRVFCSKNVENYNESVGSWNHTTSLEDFPTSRKLCKKQPCFSVPVPMITIFILHHRTASGVHTIVNQSTAPRRRVILRRRTPPTSQPTCPRVRDVSADVSSLSADFAGMTSTILTELCGERKARLTNHHHIMSGGIASFIGL